MVSKNRLPQYGEGMSSEEIKSPKIFISYSWTSEKHKKRVLDLAERLIADGVKVVLDVWDLKTGQNLHKFMEQMVNAEEISKVLLIIDKGYQTKANDGSGGVGVETEIVSSKIYNHHEQEKFIPVIFEMDSDQEPYLPTFLASRVYIDLSSENSRDEYVELLRTIYGKPLHVKPSLGKAPAFLESEVSLSVPSFLLEIKRILRVDSIENKPHLTVEFFTEVANALNDTNIQGEQAQPSDDDVLREIQSFLPVLDEFNNIFSKLVEVFPEDFNRFVRDFIEKCHDFCHPKLSSNGYYPDQYAPGKFILQELLLYIVAAYFRCERFQEFDDLFSEGIIINNRGTKKLDNILKIYEPMQILDIRRKQRLNLNRVSITADLIKERSEYCGVPFEEIAQADVIIFLRGELSSGSWYPRTVIYLNDYSVLPIFLRAQAESYFLKICPALGIKDKKDFDEKWQKNKEHIESLRTGWRPFSIERLINKDELSTK